MLHSLVGKAADVTYVDQLLHGEEIYTCGNTRYIGVDKQSELQEHKIIWSITTRPSSYKKHAKRSLIGRMRRKIGYTKTQVRAKVEYPFRIINRLLASRKHTFVACRKTAIEKNLLDLSNLQVVRKRLLNVGNVRLQCGRIPPEYSDKEKSHELNQERFVFDQLNIFEPQAERASQTDGHLRPPLDSSFPAIRDFLQPLQNRN